MGAYSYVNSYSVLNLCEVGNYCSLASELKLGLPRHQPTRVSTSSSFYADIPFLNQWRGDGVKQLPTKSPEAFE